MARKGLPSGYLKAAWKTKGANKKNALKRAWAAYRKKKKTTKKTKSAKKSSPSKKSSVKTSIVAISIFLPMLFPHILIRMSVYIFFYRSKYYCNCYIIQPN